MIFCKIQSIDKFKENIDNHWIIDKEWTEEEKVENNWVI